MARGKRRYYAYADASGKTGKYDVEMKGRVHQGEAGCMAYGGDESAPRQQTARGVVDASKTYCRHTGKESIGE